MSKISYDVWVDIYKLLDDVSLMNLALSDMSFHKSCVNEHTIRNALFVNRIRSFEFPRQILLAYNIKINKWEELCTLAERDQRILYKHNLVDIETICLQIEKTFVSGFALFSLSTFKFQVLQLDKKLMYKIWLKLFLLPRFKKLSEDVLLTVKITKVYQQTLETLTDHVLKEFREKIVINDRFIVRCFEIKMYKHLMTILRHEDYFAFDISQKSLKDLYIKISCETGDTRMLLDFIDELTLDHLSFAIQHSPPDILSCLLKFKKRIPDFKNNMNALSKTFSNKVQYKKFFEYCNR